MDLVLTKKGHQLVDSFDCITFKSEPDENNGQLEFDDKSEAIDFLNEYRKYEEGYNKLQSIEENVFKMESLNEVNQELNGNIASLFTKLKEKDIMMKTLDQRNDSLIKSQSTFLFIIDSLKKKYQELKEEYELLEETNLQNEDQLLALRRYLDIDYNLSNFDYDDCPQTLPMDYCDNDEQPTPEDELMTEVHNNEREKMVINDEGAKEIMDAEQIMEELSPEEYMEWKKDNYKDEEMTTETALKLTAATLDSLKESIAVTFDDLPHYRLGGYLEPIAEEPLKEKEQEEIDQREVERELRLHPEEPKDDAED